MCQKSANVISADCSCKCFVSVLPVAGKLQMQATEKPFSGQRMVAECIVSPSAKVMVLLQVCEACVANAS